MSTINNPTTVAAETDTWLPVHVNASLPRRIETDDTRVGQLIERRRNETVMRGRVSRVYPDSRTYNDSELLLWWDRASELGWELWLIEDAPDPDAAIVEVMAVAMCSGKAGGKPWTEADPADRAKWLRKAHAALASARAEGLLPEAGA